ncbi:MAG TPA: hypothetical protein VIK38_01050 [Coriobacteriia bacterium]
MSPEGIALSVAVFWGLTATWLAYRTARGRRGRHPPESFAERSNGLWLCGTCLSLNRRDMNFCYNCRRAKGFSGRRTPGELPVSRGVPVMAKRSAGSSDEDAGTTVAPATPRNPPPAPEILVRAPEHLLSAAVVGALPNVPACPFLGFRDDSSTRYDFPDPANLCHATSGSGTTSVASPRRFVTGVAGTRRPQPIAAQYQKSLCLTAAHEQCARYLAVEVVAAKG